MTAAIDPVALTSRLISCPSVTPQEAGTLDVLEEVLSGLGFAVHRFTAGEAPDGPVENLYASRGNGGPHFGFAGHVDVVPPGEGWASDPFTPVIRGDLLYGRDDADFLELVRGARDPRRDCGGPIRHLLHCARLIAPDPAGGGEITIDERRVL